MKGRCKVQIMFGRQFIYLPPKHCEQEKVVKGSFVDYEITNTGIVEEPRHKGTFKKRPEFVKEKPPEVEMISP
jgi:hypothetical protein